MTHRGSGGIINIGNIPRNGQVISVMKVLPESELILVSSNGMLIRIPVDEVRETGRTAMGVRVMNLPDKDSVVDAAVVPEGSDDDDENAGADPEQEDEGGAVIGREAADGTDAERTEEEQ